MAGRILVPMVIALAALPALPAGAGPGLAATEHAHIQGFAYVPQEIAILVGDTVEWDNHDGAPHTVTADDNSFNSGSMGNGGTYRRTFNAPGTIPYHCAIHPSMTGKVVVVDPNALPDLVVADLAFAVVTPGLSMDVTVTVRNDGTGTSAANLLNLAYRYQGGLVTINNAQVRGLAPGESASTLFRWDTTGLVGDFVVVARADADSRVREQDEGNNAREETATVLVGGIAGINVRDPL